MASEIVRLCFCLHSSQLLIGLKAGQDDLPFAVLYSAGEDVLETLSESSEHSQNLKNWALEGLVRCSPSDAIPSRINSEIGVEEFITDFMDIIKADYPTLLEGDALPAFVKDVSIAEDLRCTSVVLLPIRSTGDNILGFLLLGVNPRKAYDSDYKILMELLSRQLSTSMAVSIDGDRVYVKRCADLFVVGSSLRRRTSPWQDAGGSSQSRQEYSVKKTRKTEARST